MPTSGSTSMWSVRSSKARFVRRRSVRRRAAIGVFVALGVACSTSLVADPATSATRRRVAVKTKAKAKPKTTTPSTNVASVDTMPAQTTTTAPAVLDAPVIEAIRPTAKGAELVLGAPPDASAFARIALTSVGRERINVQVDGAPGSTLFTIERPIDPDTQYTIRAAWVRSGIVGPTVVKVIPPSVPQPLNRDRPPVAGPGWTALLSGEFTPTRRNPCAPWKIVYDSRSQPVAFEASVTQAINALKTASGLNIIDGGVVNTRVNDPYAIVISWDTAVNATLGVARQVYRKDAQGVVWRTTGTITMAARRRGISQDRWYAVLLHELGHIFGLDHSHDPTSLMYSPIESGADWPYVASIYTPADAAGLFALNTKMTGGGCTTQLDDPEASKPIV